MVTLALASTLLFARVRDPALPDVPQQLVNLFEAHEYVAGGQRFHYRLFVPRNLQPTKRYPLLLWLHGAGQGGMDNRENLMYLQAVFSDLNHPEKYRFFILVPQCPSEDIVWTTNLGAEGDRHIFRSSDVSRQDSTTDRKMSQSPAPANDMLTVTHQIFQKTMQEQPVDPDRIYLLGVCSRGNGCWEMAMRYPEMFAAVVPTTPGGGDVSQAGRLINIPIWAFHNKDAEPEGTIEMVAAVQRAGGNIHLTLQQSSEHDSWDLAIKRYDIMNWMLEQRRGQWICWWPPGCRGWRWWHILGVPLAFLSIVCLGWYSEKRRRNSSRPKGTL